MSIWKFAFNNFIGIGYLRMPVILLFPFAYRVILSDAVDNAFAAANAGHGQNAIWDRIEAKVKAQE